MKMLPSRNSRFEDAYVDPASVAQIVQAFQRGMKGAFQRDMEDAYIWSWKSLIEMTSYLTFAPNIHIMGYAVPENAGLEALLRKELYKHDFVQAVKRNQSEFDTANRAIIETFDESSNVKQARDHLNDIGSDIAHLEWRKWARANAWVHHANAGNGLFDKAYIPILADIIPGADKRELTRLWAKTTDIDYVKKISKADSESIKEGIDIVVIDDAFVMAAKLRGLINGLSNYPVSSHHLRRDFLDIFLPSAEFADGTPKIVESKLTDSELSIVVHLIAISLSLSSPEDGATTWVKNIASVRGFIAQQEQGKSGNNLLEHQDDPEKAKRNAIKLVREELKEELEIKVIPDVAEKIDSVFKILFPESVSILLKQIPEAAALEPALKPLARVIAELKPVQRLSKKYYKSEKRLSKLVEKVNGRIESALGKTVGQTAKRRSQDEK